MEGLPVDNPASLGDISMKTGFAVILTALILISVVAWQWQPNQVESGKIPMSWVSDDNPGRREQVDLFKRLNPEIDLRLDPNNQGMEKIIIQSVAGVGPDLFDCYDPVALSVFVKSGIAWDVTDELKKMGVDADRDIWAAAIPSMKYQGRIYGFPTNVANGVLWFNKGVFDKYHISYPTGPMTWQELVPIAQRLTLRDARGRVKQYGLLMDWSAWSQFVRQWGGRVYSPDGTRCVLDSREAIAAVQFMHDLIYKYKVIPSPSDEAAMASQGGWGTGSMSRFGGEKGAMALGGRYWLCTLRGYKDLRLGAVECPHGKYRVFMGGARITIINKNSPRRREALKFLRFLAGKEYNELVNHQADGLSPVIKYAYTNKYMHDRDFPEEDYNAVWRDTMKNTVTYEFSPFVAGAVDQRILNQQMDLVRNNQKSPAAALKTAAAQINAEIQKSISEDPTLRKQYEDLVRERKSGAR